MVRLELSKVVQSKPRRFLFVLLESVVFVYLELGVVEGHDKGVVLRTLGGVVTGVEHQLHSSVSPQLELNVLTEAVRLISWSQADPAVRVNQVRVSTVDINIPAARVEASRAGVELS